MIYPEVENIAFCCANCGVPVIQNSREHDESVCSPDGEDWYCVNCHECVDPIQDQDETIFELVLGMFESIREQYSQDNRPHFRSTSVQNEFHSIFDDLVERVKKIVEKKESETWRHMAESLLEDMSQIKQKYQQKQPVMEYEDSNAIDESLITLIGFATLLLETGTEEQGLPPDEKTDRCVCCGIFMGFNSTRQLCEKTYCPFVEDEFRDT